jgi:hypothetical protein
MARDQRARRPSVRAQEAAKAAPATRPTLQAAQVASGSVDTTSAPSKRTSKAARLAQALQRKADERAAGKRKRQEDAAARVEANLAAEAEARAAKKARKAAEKAAALEQKEAAQLEKQRAAEQRRAELEAVRLEKQQAAALRREKAADRAAEKAEKAAEREQRQLERQEAAAARAAERLDNEWQAIVAATAPSDLDGTTTTARAFHQNVLHAALANEADDIVLSKLPARDRAAIAFLHARWEELPADVAALVQLWCERFRSAWAAAAAESEPWDRVTHPCACVSITPWMDTPRFEGRCTGHPG